MERKNSFSLKNTLSSFQYRNYRIWFLGQILSLFGTWMQNTAQAFFAYELTHSEAYLGYIIFAGGIPSWLFMLYGGVIADRIPRKTLLIITQIALLLQALFLAGLTFLDLITPSLLIVLAFLQGIINAFDAPARQSFVSELVDRKDITNAIALNSTMFNSANAIGPAISGVIYALFGPGWCFTINGISYFAVITALFMMKLPPALPYNPKTTKFEELKEGILYTLNQPMICLLTVIVGLFTVFGFSFVTLIPAWSTHVLSGDATTNGFLQSSRGFGSLLGALVIASLGQFTFKGKLLTAGLFSFPVFLFCFGVIRDKYLSMVILCGIGFSLILIYNLANALIQTLVTDSFRGRVMGIYSLTFFGMMPIGGLVVGLTAEILNSETTIFLCATLVLFLASFIWLKYPKFREI